MPLTNAGREALEALSPRTRPVTEEEARNKSCPLTFAQNGGPFGCVGSSCMHWRFKNYGTTGDRIESTGFCGPAGDPS